MRYETAALVAVAIALALAWLVFIGQALARQSAREQRDARLLLSLGMTRSQRIAAAGLRAAPAAIGVALIAAVTCVLLSPATPIGRARLAEVDLGLHIDGFVVLVGAAALVAATLAGLAGAAWFSLREPRGAVPRSSLLRRQLPLIAVAGISFMSSPQRRSLALRAGAATAVAVAVVVAGLGLRDSFDYLTADTRSRAGHSNATRRLWKAISAALGTGV